MSDIIYAAKYCGAFSAEGHSHDTSELICCTDGESRFDIDSNQTFLCKKGSVVVLPSKKFHSFVSTQDYVGIHIHISDPSPALKTAQLFTDNANHFICDAFTAVFFHFNSEDGRNTLLLSSYGDLIIRYLDSYSSACRLSPAVESIKNSIILNFTDCRYMLDEYLLSLPFNYDYLRKLFKKEVGVTPHKYLQDKRLNTAADILRTASREISIAEVAQLCGFHEPLYFSRMFKKEFGAAPSYYMNSSQCENADLCRGLSGGR